MLTILRSISFVAVFTLLHNIAFTQAKTMAAVKINEHVVIDGDLDDKAWQSVPGYGDFITYSPAFGKPSSHKTIVKIAYDDSAVYVGAYMFADPATIRRQLTARDVISRQDVDIFTVGFDTYHDKQNAFVFRVTPAGTQGDAKLSAGGTIFDQTWDAVWQSVTSIKKDGWVAEMRIPFSAIRFSKNNLQDWGLNFSRFIRAENENSIWSPENPNISGDVNQWGTWSGLKNIRPPLRLSFLPYLSGGVQVSPTGMGNVTHFLKSGGMDVKYGINESFTLDMTLVPDFAQVQSDNVYLNLSPFEVKFDDYRPFFTEGTELFNKAGLFYSRRVGASPALADSVLTKYGDNPAYEIEKNPGITRLYNATKLSGRTKNNLGIGIFNALTVPMYAKVKDVNTGKDTTILTEPFTNYNIIVLDQALRHRSSISFTNTNVLRKGNSRNANVSSLDLSLYDKKNTYNLAFAGRYSTIWGNDLKKNGYNTLLGFTKVSGLIQYNAGYSITSDKYDPNDLGYLENNNAFEYHGSIGYFKPNPTRNFLSHSYNLHFQNNFLYKPFNWTTFSTDITAAFLFKNYWDLTGVLEVTPEWSKDYFVNSSVYTGFFLKRSPTYYLQFSGSSDSRKKLYWTYLIGGGESPLPKDPYWTTNMGLRYRFNDKFQLSTSMEVEQNKGNWGWSYLNNTNGSPIIAKRNVKSNTAIIEGLYSFTPRMNLSVRVRHYWSLLHNTNFYNLKTDGYWDEIAFIPGRDVDFNTFNIDMFYTWDFLLGSRITIAWKNALGNNVVIDPYTNTNYFRNLGKVLDNPHSNEITVKIVYFLDYLKLKKKR